MRTSNKNLSNEEAFKGLKQLSTVGVALSMVGLFIFWWLGIIGFVLAAQAWNLSKHPGNIANPEARRYKFLAIAGIAIGIADVVLVSLPK